MKSYEQMAESVLMREKIERAAQKKRRGKIVTVAVCMCLTAMVVFFGGMTKRIVDGGDVRDPRVSVFCVTANAAEQRQKMIESETLPYNAVLRVRDITGLGPEELNALRNADKEYAKQLAGENSFDYGGLDWGMTNRTTDQVMVSAICVGSFYMTVDDYAQIQDVTATTTQIGHASQYHTNYYDASQKDGIGISWALSETGVDMIEENPSMPLSQIKDTVTVTVEFKDGTKEIVIIDITVDDDGQIYGTFRGTDVIG